jgi:hypothetical protein
VKFFTRHPKIFTALIVLYASTFFITSIPLVVSDLGRHIMNGKLVWLTVASRTIGDAAFTQATQDGVGSGTAEEWKDALQYSVLSTNTYSFTHPDFPVINHHWLFGVIAYGVFLLGGFQLLTVLNVVVVGSAIALMLVAARQKSSWGGVWAAAALLLPLVTNRTEVRPESFSLLFAAGIFLLLSRFTQHKLSLPLTILGILVIQALWVNTHVFFILGLGVIGVFWLESLFGTRKQLLQLTSIGVLAAATSLLNPNGIAGALAPFNIFSNYDFLVAENQSTFFMLRVLPRAVHWYYPLVLMLTAGSFLLVVRSELQRQLERKQLLLDWKKHLPWVLYVVVLAGVGLEMNRFYSFFALLALPPLARVLSFLLPSLQAVCKQIYEHSYALPFASLAGFGILGACVASGLFFPNPLTFQLGIPKGIEQPAVFFSTNPPDGKLFNNYDIGGYLIFYLFPRHRVYTDNRPQEYPPGFFQNYREIQNDSTAWQKYSQATDGTAIFFNRNDLTDHGQKFLVERIQDPEWAPVFVDAHTLIFYKRTAAHENILSRYELLVEKFIPNPAE